MIRSGSLPVGRTRSSERRKSGDAHAQHRRVERHVDTGHQDERPLAAADLAAALHLFLQGLKAAHRAGDRILRAAQVEVHDLQEFTCARGYLVDERGHVGVGQVDLRRADRGQPVVGPAVLRHAARCRASSSRGGTPPQAGLPARRRRTHTPARCTHRPSARTRSRPRRMRRARASRRPARPRTVAIATWVNCVRYSTPSGCW